MCLLGNDFLPHGLTLKIRDGGHDTLLGYMRKLRAAGLRFVDYETKKVNYDTFRQLFEELAKIEEANLLTAIYNKKGMRPMPPRNDTERLMMSVQNLPVDWFVEREFLDRGALRADWKEVYEHHLHANAVAEYLHGIQWVVDYYVGRQVDLLWYYPWHLPPLWSRLAAESSMQEPLLAESSMQEPLKPQEQLAIVLPLESWHLVRNPTLRRVPNTLPQFWPNKFGFMSLGKSWMWECEADIPILSPGRLRFAVKT
jgi:5'-3' exonuclease